MIINHSNILYVRNTCSNQTWNQTYTLSQSLAYWGLHLNKLIFTLCQKQFSRLSSFPSMIEFERNFREVPLDFPTGCSIVLIKSEQDIEHVLL